MYVLLMARNDTPEIQGFEDRQGSIQFWNCFFKKMELINLVMKFATKILIHKLINHLIY